MTTETETRPATAAAARPRREVYAEQTRAALVEVATKFFLSKGYNETSVQDIVDAANVSKGAFYHHFADKRALFREILMAACQAGADAARAAIAEASDQSSADPVSLGAEHALSALIDNEPYRQLRAESILALGLEMRREVDQTYTLPVIREALNLVPGAGSQSSAESDALALMLSSLLESAANEISLSDDPVAAYGIFRKPLLQIIEAAVAASAS